MPPRLAIFRMLKRKKPSYCFETLEKLIFIVYLLPNWIEFLFHTLPLHKYTHNQEVLFVFLFLFKIERKLQCLLLGCYFTAILGRFFLCRILVSHQNLGKHKASSLSFFLRRKMVPFAKVDFKRRLAPQKTVRNYVFGTLATEKLETNAFFNCCLSSDAWDLLKCLSYIA